MDIPNVVFDRFHKSHPHVIRFDRAEKDKVLEPYLEMLSQGRTMRSKDGHQLRKVTRQVRPWINWRMQFEEFAPEKVAEILEQNQPEVVSYLEIR